MGFTSSHASLCLPNLSKSICKTSINTIRKSASCLKPGHCSNCWQNGYLGETDINSIIKDERGLGQFNKIYLSQQSSGGRWSGGSTSCSGQHRGAFALSQLHLSCSGLHGLGAQALSPGRVRLVNPKEYCRAGLLKLWRAVTLPGPTLNAASDWEKNH